MAGYWIKFDTSTPDKPEVWSIAERLSIDPDAVVGKLLRVWAWFDDHTEKGNAPSVTKALLDRRVGVTGFCDAMISSGWLVEKNGALSIPNFDRHNGATAKSRCLTAKRVANHKAGNAKGNAPSVSGALPRAETEAETDQKEDPSLSAQGSGRDEYTERFEKFWSVYPTARRTKKKEAFRRWCVAIRNADAEMLIRRAIDYAASDQGKSEFAVMPSVWLNSQMWQDAPEAWMRRGSNPTPGSNPVAPGKQLTPMGYGKRTDIPHGARTDLNGRN